MENSELILAEKIIRILDARKAKAIKLLHVAKKTMIADYFIICDANSTTQVKSLCDEIEYRLGNEGFKARTEGLTSALWVIVDFGNVLVHIFNSETRKYYNLERLWNEAEEIDISALLSEN